jgi:hypothetical protein
MEKKQRRAACRGRFIFSPGRQFWLIVFSLFDAFYPSIGGVIFYLIMRASGMVMFAFRHLPA